MLRKIYIAVECRDDAQKERVQKIAEEISQMRMFDGDALESIYPELKKRKQKISEMIHYIMVNGVQGVKSFKFIGLLSELIL